MNDGIIAVARDDFDTIDGFNTSYEERDFELNECVDVTNQSNVNGEIEYQIGRALIEDTQKVSVPYVEDGEIKSEKQWQKVVNTTDFIIAPGSFVIVTDTSGKFFFDIMEDITDTSFSRPTIDLDSYAQTRSGGNPWMYGFDNAGGNAEKGVVYGENVVEDPDMGEVLERSDKNQLGLQFSYSGNRVKMSISANGYVRIIEPGASDGFLKNFVQDEFEPFW